MTSGRIYRMLLALALCGAIWFLGDQAYQAYRAGESDPVVTGASPAAAAESTPPAQAAAVTLPALEQLTQTIERPMFSPSRRPVEVAETAGEPQGPAEDMPFELIGIVIWKGERIAFVRSGADPQVIKIGVGGNVAGWVAVDIEPESVRFRNGGKEKEVRLKYVNRDSNG